jgi:SAM-dependent methyltransferase
MGWVDPKRWVAIRMRLARAALALRRDLPREERALIAAYRACLGRAPDDAGRRFFLPQLADGRLDGDGLCAAIHASVEFRRRWGLPLDAPTALHHARCCLVAQHLPPADVIVDLGGAASQSPSGALLLMGYPHVPRELTIVDLPVDERLGDWSQAAERPALVTADGTRVRYLYRADGQLGGIGDASVDLVFSGESIEHVTEADAERFVAEAYRVLRPGGFFCLDTPNRALTVLQSPDAFIHPEHKKEYTVDELVAMVERRGFEVLDASAICPMPRSRATGRFDWDELAANPVVGPVAEDGYLFFLKCRKPEDAGAATSPAGAPEAGGAR